MAIFNPLIRINPGLEKGYPARRYIWTGGLSHVNVWRRLTEEGPTRGSDPTRGSLQSSCKGPQRQSLAARLGHC